KLPFLGICLGLQAAIIEFARDAVKLPDTNSSEFAPECENPVIALMRSQEGIHELGGTMRLGAYPCKLRTGPRAGQVYGALGPRQRHGAARPGRAVVSARRPPRLTGRSTSEGGAPPS